MKTFKNIAAQGDFIIIRVEKFPEGLVPLEAEKGQIVIAHSETGHNHVMEMDRAEAFVAPNSSNVDLYEMFLNVKEPAEINHQRSFDTHETILVTPGKYMVRRQREYTPEGFRKAAD